MYVIPLMAEVGELIDGRNYCATSHCTRGNQYSHWLIRDLDTFLNLSDIQESIVYITKWSIEVDLLLVLQELKMCQD